MIELYMNIKTKNYYQIIDDNVINCTNKEGNQIMILYKEYQGSEKMFVREKSEFHEKFKKVDCYTNYAGVF